MIETKPINFIEDKLKLLLCVNGYDQKDIQFKDSLGGGLRYLRVGYWMMIDEDIICSIQQNMKIILKPTSFWDDDCGYKTWYDILINKESN